MGSGSSKGTTKVLKSEAVTVTGGKAVVKTTSNTRQQDSATNLKDSETNTRLPESEDANESTNQGDGDDIYELAKLRGELDVAIQGQDGLTIKNQETDGETRRYSKGISQYYKPTAKVWAIPRELANEERRIKEKEKNMSKNSTRPSGSPSHNRRENKQSNNEDEGFGSFTIENSVAEKNSKSPGFDASKFKEVNLKVKRSNGIFEEPIINHKESENTSASMHTPIISALEPKYSSPTSDAGSSFGMPNEIKTELLPNYDDSELNLIESIEKEFDP